MISDDKFQELENRLREKGSREGEGIFDRLQKEIEIKNPEDRLVFLAVLQENLIHGIRTAFKKIYQEIHTESPE